MPTDNDLLAFADKLDLAVASLQRAALGLRQIIDKEIDADPDKRNRKRIAMSDSDWQRYKDGLANK